MTNVEKFWTWHLSWMHRDATSAVASWSAYAQDCYRDYLRCMGEGRDQEAGVFAAEERRALREAAKHAGIAADYAARERMPVPAEFP